MQNGTSNSEPVEKTASSLDKRIARKRAMRQLLPVAMLGLVGALCVFAAAFVLERQNAEAKFRELAEQKLSVVRGHIAAVQDIVGLTAGHFSVMPAEAVSGDTFRRFVEPIFTGHPFIQALSWNPRIVAAGLSDFEAKVRSRTGQEYRVVERAANNSLVPVGARESYVPILYIEPLARNAVALGFDLFSDPVRRPAIEAAQEAGVPRATGRIRLVQETGDQFSVLIIGPAYSGGGRNGADRQKLPFGFVSGVLRISDLIEGGEVVGGSRNIELHLFDLDGRKGERRLYPRKGDDDIDALKSGLHLAQEFDMSGRRWLLIAVPDRRFLSENAPLVSLGVLIAVLLASAFYVIHLRSRLLAIEVAEDHARALEDARRKLAMAQAVSRIGSIDINSSDGMCEVGEGARVVLGLSELTEQPPLSHPLKMELKEAFRNVPETSREAICAMLLASQGNAVETEIVVGNGNTTKVVLLRSEPDRDAASATFTLTLQDISARRAAERERAEMMRRMAESGRLEALGTLAGGIAHEINTPVQYIGDNLRFIRGGISELQEVIAAYESGDIEHAKGRAKEIDVAFLAEELPAAADQGLDGIGRIARIVQSIKAFSHPGSETAARFDLNETISAAVTVSRNSWKYVAEVVTDLDPSLPLVMGSQNEIGQVILNLVLNAAHAVEEAKPEAGGRIAITSRLDGGHAVVTVADNGKGVPKALEQRIFDLFFTTKGPGRGTGQGLAISRSIVVKNHGGSIDVGPTPGGGATFTVRLPVDGKDVA